MPKKTAAPETFGEPRASPIDINPCRELLLRFIRICIELDLALAMQNEDFRKAFGVRRKDLRKYKCRSQKEQAAKADIHSKQQTQPAQTSLDDKAVNA